MSHRRVTFLGGVVCLLGMGVLVTPEQATASSNFCFTTQCSSQCPVIDPGTLCEQYGCQAGGSCEDCNGPQSGKRVVCYFVQ